MLCIALIEIVSDADIPAVVFAFENINKGTNNNGFKHFNNSLYINLMDIPPPPPTMTPAEKHYEAQRRASKAYYQRKHPNPRPRGRPKKVASELI